MLIIYGLQIKSGLRGGRADSPRCKSMKEDLQQIQAQLAEYNSENDTLVQHFGEGKVGTSINRLSNYVNTLQTYIGKECS